MYHHSSDATYPSFPIISFLGFILALIPLSWHLQAWNVGTCAFMIWTSLACLFGFINSLVWAGNVLNVAPIWCDISSKYLLGAGVGITASTLCITRRLYRIAKIPVVAHSRREKLRAVYCDLSVAVGIPVLVMVLHYIVQPHRFDILEDIGCYAVVYNTLPAYFLVFQWPVTLGAISFYYSAMTLWAIWKRQKQMNELMMSFHGPSLRKRYSRLVAFALTNMVLTVPIGVFIIYLGTKGVEYAPWVSWSDTHFDFSRVDLVRSLVWRDGSAYYSRIAVELTRWVFPASSIIFFGFFGFTSESWKQYECFWTRVKRKRWISSSSSSSSSSRGATTSTHILQLSEEDDRSSLSTVKIHDQRYTLEYLRKESVDIYNRLHSIEEDIRFVQHVRAAYPGFPIFPNLRCGAWYTNPEDNVPVYFKSTDGHFNNWSFNLRRANLHLLPVLAKHGGIILVDSTRSGKRMPDAFSKTVPTWCAVINRAVGIRFMMGQEREDTKLYTPPGSVSVQEHEQIEKRIDGWVGNLVSSSFDIPHLKGVLRPFWITPGTSRYPTVFEEGVIPVLCVSASKQVCEGRSGGYTYIQGSGDDHELWGMGLDPSKFWKYRQVLLQADRSRLVGLVERIMGEEEEGRRIELTPIARVGGLVSIASGSTEDVCGLELDADGKVYILITSSKGATRATTTQSQEGPPPPAIHLSIPAGKKGQAGLLETVFPRAVDFVRSHVVSRGELPRICCVCDGGSGFDRCVGVAVVLLQVFFDEEGVLRCLREITHGGHRNAAAAATKATVRRRLQWVISSEPRANATRTTLKRVDEYLMSGSRRRMAISSLEESVPE